MTQILQAVLMLQFTGPTVGIIALSLILAPIANAQTASCPECGHPQALGDTSEHYDVCSYSAGSKEAQPSADNPLMGQMDSSLQQAAFNLGSAFGKWLVSGDGGATARADAERDRQRESERRQLLEAEAQRRQALYDSLRSQLKLDGLSSDLQLKTFDGDSGGLVLKGLDEDADSGLQPRGTDSFHERGSGGAQPGAYSDPMVVDLRDLRVGYYLASQANRTIYSVPQPGPTDPLLEEAFSVAVGEKEPLIPMPPDSALPIVPEQGLLAFQKANIVYREAKDSRYWSERRLQEAAQRLELARRIADASRAQYERRLATALQGENLTPVHTAMAEVFAAVKAEDDAHERAARHLEEQTRRLAESRDDGMSLLLQGGAGQPIVLPPRLSGWDLDAEREWAALQSELFSSRDAVEHRLREFGAQLDTLHVPAPASFDRVHEGLILGMYTEGDRAALDQATLTSGFSGRSYPDMNATADEAGGGAMVVSFGEPDQERIAQWINESGRGVLDHKTDGAWSPTTPQGREAVERLTGREFNRLLAHSNGNMLALTLIERRLVKVHELNVLGGDSCMVQQDRYASLVDRGLVDRVVVWVNVTDPIPWGTSLAKYSQLTADPVELVQRSPALVRSLAAENPRVEYRFFHRPAPGFFGPHDVRVYYDAIAAQYGTATGGQK